MKRERLDHASAWVKAVDDNEVANRGLPRDGESNDSKTARLAFGSYKLECFLECVCVQLETPWLELTRLEAGRLYLLNKHHWTPEVLKQVQKNDLIAILHKELTELSLTKEEFDPVHNWCMHLSCYSDLLASANLQT